MRFNILDTESSYRRLLEAADATTREALFRAELAEPFAGLAQVFGMSDPVAAFAMWNMKPEQFTGEQREWAAGLLDQLQQVKAWERAAQALERGYQAFAAHHADIPGESITFGLMLADMSAVPQAGGYSGFGAIPGWIMTVYGAATDHNLGCVEAATVHELHHNLVAAIGPAKGILYANAMTATVGDYMLMEGLAESFAAELYGADKIGPWVTAFDESQLERTKAIFRAGLNRSGFNVVRGYIFGGALAADYGFEAVDVPPNAGYALGYKMVQAYLQRSGKSVVEASFVPTQQVIEESGFFE